MMTTSETLMERARSIAGTDVAAEDAVRELLSLSGERRVAVVRARQQLLASTEGSHDDPATTHAVELLDEVLNRLPV